MPRRENELPTSATLAVDSALMRADRAEKQYGPFASTHEAYGVLVEEVAEMFQAMRDNNHEAFRDEAIDVAAVALRIAAQARWPRG